MKRFLYILIVAVILSASMDSCKAVKNFLSQDLEDEDFIIGQLYADELVEEKPIEPVRIADRARVVSTSRSGIELTDMDNAKLYAVIDEWYGTPYKYGGCSKNGVDCSCFVGSIFSSVYGVELHRGAADIQKDVKLINRSQLKEGDIVFFTNSNGKVSHVGIYLRDDMFVHSSTSRGVMVSKLSNTYWDSHFFKGGRHKAVTTKY